MTSGAVAIIKDRTRINYLEKMLNECIKFHNIVGRNEEMQKVYSLIEDIAYAPTTVLITGESGTGKELLAEAIHYKSPRREQPLVFQIC